MKEIRPFSWWKRHPRCWHTLGTLYMSTAPGLTYTPLIRAEKIELHRRMVLCIICALWLSWRRRRRRRRRSVSPTIAWNQRPRRQILSSQSILFRHFYQVNFSCQNIVNRKDEVGLDIRFSGVQKIHMQMRTWKRLWWWSNMANFIKWSLMVGFRLADTGIFMNRNRLAI